MLGNAGLAVSLLALTAIAAPLEAVRPSEQMARRALHTRTKDHVTVHKAARSETSHSFSKSAGHTMNLKKRSSKTPSTRSAAHHLKSRSKSGDAKLKSLLSGIEYATEITFGDQTFEVIVDTGSSDTWVPQVGFHCIDLETGQNSSRASCGFGPELYKPSSTFKRIPGQGLYLSYGDGEYAYGYMGNESVTMAGITVNQEVGVVNRAAWNGDSITSGLVGLAYPAITNGINKTTQNEIHYDPIFTTMYKEGLVDPYFSMAISRDTSGDGGYLTLGGLPPIDFNETWTSTDIYVTDIEGYVKHLDFYTLHVDDITVGDKAIKKAGGKNTYIVDSGTSLNLYPTAAADAIAKAYSPKAKKDISGGYTVDCNATAPAHGITIAGTTFTINPVDMIIDNGDGTCSAGIADGGDDAKEDVFILGDTFMKNVVAVFDVGAGQLHFAPNSDY